jgi:gamma-glutamylputrescine oxidase
MRPPPAPSQERFADSWYAATAWPERFCPTLGPDEDFDTDVCIVGGGFTGLNCALELADRGIRAVLLESGQVGFGASGRSGGIIRHGFAGTQDQIERQLGREAAGFCWTLSQEGVERIVSQIRRYDIDCDLHWGLITTASNARQMRELAARLDGLRRRGYTRARQIDGAALREDIDSPAYIGGLHDSGCGQIHPLRYAQGLARAAMTRGVQIFEESRASRIDAKPNRVEVMTTRGGRIRAQQLVLAGNVDVAPLAPRSGLRFLPVWSHIIATEPLDVELASRLLPRRAAVCDTRPVPGYFRLTPDRRMLFGCRTRHPKHETASIAAKCFSELTRIFPDLAGHRVDYSWGGYLDMGIDTLPRLGQAAPRIYYAQGFAGHGVALTGLAGQLLAEAIDTGSAGFDLLSRLQPYRSPLHLATTGPLISLGGALLRLCDRFGV